MCDSEAGSAEPTTLIKNDRVIVTKWRFDKRGQNTGWHRHQFDYVIVPLTDGDVQVSSAPDQVTSASMVQGVPYYREKGVEHDVISDNDSEFAFLEIEIVQ